MGFIDCISICFSLWGDGAFKCYIMLSGGMFGSGYFSITNVYGPTLLVLRGDGGCQIYRKKSVM